MKKNVKILIASLIVISTTCLSGCKQHRTSDQSKIPWARPASWQHNSPQMGASISY